MRIELILHIISGSVALLAGLGAIVSPKGKKIHRLSGKIYFYSMLFVAATAAITSVRTNNLFLLLIGFFAFYMTFAGFISVKRKSLKPNLFDWALLIVAIGVMLFMLYTMNIILLVFGAAFGYLLITELMLYLKISKGKKIEKTAWLRRHLGMMLGSYISALTAFTVVNIQYAELPWLPWVLPTIIGTPLIFYWSAKYKSK